MVSVSVSLYRCAQQLNYVKKYNNSVEFRVPAHSLSSDPAGSWLGAAACSLLLVVAVAVALVVVSAIAALPDYVSCCCLIRPRSPAPARYSKSHTCYWQWHSMLRFGLNIDYRYTIDTCYG